MTATDERLCGWVGSVSGTLCNCSLLFVARVATRISPVVVWCFNNLFESFSLTTTKWVDYLWNDGRWAASLSPSRVYGGICKTNFVLDLPGNRKTLQIGPAIQSVY